MNASISFVATCVLDDHAGHKYNFVKKAAPAVKEKLAECLTPLKETQVTLCDAAKSIKSTKSDIKKQGASVAASIEQSFLELHEILERHKRELLKKTSNLVKGKLERLNVQEKGFEMASGTIQSLVEFVEQNIENATDEELMIVHTQMLNRIDEETRKHQQCNVADLDPVEEANIVVGVECAGELRKLCQERAVIITAPFNPFKSTIQGDGLRSAEVNKVAMVKFNAVFPDPFNKEQNKSVVIKARLTSSVSGTTVSAKIENKSESIYEIEYIPHIQGRHQLEVTVNGVPLAGSPFPVFVKIHPIQFGKPLKILPGLIGFGITFSACGELVFGEREGDIVFLDKTGNKLRTIAKYQHGFQSLFGIAVDDDDNVYVTDSRGGCIFKFDRHGAKIKCVKSDSTVINFGVRGIVVSSDQVIVADTYNHRLLSFTKDLCLTKTIDCHSGGGPFGVACDQSGNIYVCNYYKLLRSGLQYSWCIPVFI